MISSRTLPSSPSKERILLILGVSAFVIFLTNLAVITGTGYRDGILPIPKSLKHLGQHSKVQTALIIGGEGARTVMLTFGAAAHNS